MDVAEAVPDLQRSWLDAHRTGFDVDGRQVEAGAPRMQLYRIRDSGDATSWSLPIPPSVPQGDIQSAVHQVLLRARRGVTQRQKKAGYGRCFLTDYQILALLWPTSMRDDLMGRYGSPAACAAKVIRPVAESLPDVVRIWFDAPGTGFTVQAAPIPPHSTTMPMYRIPGGVTGSS